MQTVNNLKNIRCSKSQLVQAMFRLDNEPYSLKTRKPLEYLYDMDGNDTLLMMGRQYGKSTFIATDSLCDAATIPFFNTLYVSPRQDQTSEFSSSKLLPLIRFSPVFKELFVDNTTIQNVSKKTFLNGSSITLKYAFHTADAIRGVSADKTTIDEVQDIIMANVPIIEECLSGSKYQWRTYAGTPKTLNNTLAQLWFRSTQNEWVLKCSGCNKYNVLEMKNIGAKGLICKKCGKDLPRDAEGQWVAMKEIDHKTIFMTGFRVPQVVSPMVQWHKIREKLETSPNTFLNEVMALPSDNSANPLTETELKAVCSPDRLMRLTRTDAEDDFHLFLGVDWGHGDISVTAKRGGAPTGYTVLTLGYYDWDQVFKVLAFKKFSGSDSDPLSQVEFIAALINRLGITAAGTDWGAGFMHNAQLRHKTDPDKIIEWQANDGLRVSAKWIPEASRMVFNRTDCMTETFVSIKNKRVELPKWEEFKEFAPDFLTICVDFRSGNGNMFYNHVLPDDAFHSFMMCKMTADHMLFSTKA